MTSGRAANLGMVACQACGLVCQATSATDAGQASRCPRCTAPLYRRKPYSLQRATAFLLAGMVLYIPANLMAVMYTSQFGRGSDSTIMSGVIEFWQTGAWDIALIIFIASVVVPCTKFIALGLLLVTTHRRSDWARRERTRLYRIVELIGYWSMLDVLVVALVAALVQFQALSYIEPRVGILFFGMVVILTMLSALSFDPRLMWDERKPHDPTS